METSSKRQGKRRKADGNDAPQIPWAWCSGDCLTGFIADAQLMHRRKLGGHWRRRSRTIGRAKHARASIFHAANLPGPKRASHRAQRWLLARGHLLKEASRDVLANHIDLVALVERQRVTLRRNTLRRKIIFAIR